MLGFLQFWGFFWPWKLTIIGHWIIFNSTILFPWWLSCFFARCLYFHRNLWKERGTKINSSNIFEGCYWQKKCGNSWTQLTLDNLNIQKIELLKIKLSHKLPSKQNYLLSKTFTFDNSNSHCLEQICFIALSFFGFELSRVNCSCSHFFSLAS